MPLVCSVCTHPKLKEINTALVAGVPSLRDMAGLYGLTKSALDRHRKCNGAALARRAEVIADRRGESLAEEIRRKKAEAEEIQAMATRDGDPRTALMAVKVYADLVKLLLDAAALAASGPDEVEVILQVRAD